MRIKTHLLAILVSAAPVGAMPVWTSGGSGSDDPAAGFHWDDAKAEHLLNRAGFGATPREIRRAVRIGPEALIDELLAGPEDPGEPYFAERLSNRDGGMEAMREREGMDMEGKLDEDVKKDLVRKMRREDTFQLVDYTTWWIERMVASEDPLRDRMTLFWHGYFTSSQQDVKSSFKLIHQHQFLRENALGSFGDLVHGIARDPAMLEYLDNRTNRKKKPNENFARELMELFTLGEGNYTEDDVKQAARAFTGWTETKGEFKVTRRKHDKGVKNILGEKGRYDGEQVIDILLTQEACPRWVAGKLLAYFEGVDPAEERVEQYAANLRETDYDLSAFLRKLFLDPGFYRDEVVGTRISSPVDYLVGSTRRLGVRTPNLMIAAGAQILGQRLFYPPNVKGWEEGQAWITTSTLMQRGNLAGVMLDLIDIDDVIREDEIARMSEDEGSMSMDGEMDAVMDGGMEMETDDAPAKKPKVKLSAGMKTLDRILAQGWRPRIHLKVRLERAGATTDEEIVDRLLEHLLAVEAGPDTREELIGFLAREREELELLDGELTVGGYQAELLLRRLAHLILCLPEAQLH